MAAIGPEVQAIFWDNDGVLVDTEHLYFEANRRVFETAGIPLNEEQYLELFLRQGCGAWHLAEAAGIAHEEIVRLRGERDRLYSTLLQHTSEVLPGIHAVLEHLHGNRVMGVVTSSKREHFDLIHRSSGLLKYFDFVIADGDYARAKPEPDPYRLAIERSGVDKDTCLAIEDSERGLESATRAGIRCIVIPTPLTRGCQFRGAHRILKGAGELMGTL